MAATTSEPGFHKFPRTPHMAGSAVVDDDEVVTPSQVAATIAAARTTSASQLPLSLVVQEKVDGANVGVYFLSQWNVVCQKRGDIIHAHEKPQYNVFRDWCNTHIEELWECLGTEYCLFGEWLWELHSVYYDSLPDFFIAFDVLHIASNKFVSHRKVNEILRGKFATVPLLHEGPVPVDIPGIVQTALKSVSHSRFSTTIPAEGVYIRIEDTDWVVDRFKLRRQNFECGRHDFNTHKANRLLSDKSTPPQQQQTETTAHTEHTQAATATATATTAPSTGRQKASTNTAAATGVTVNKSGSSSGSKATKSTKASGAEANSTANTTTTTAAAASTKPTAAATKNTKGSTTSTSNKKKPTRGK
ncbi:RNA ligase [Pelomyxa schiedti]|nr:RNA ligase [Pelomyxa schiedti]